VDASFTGHFRVEGDAHKVCLSNSDDSTIREFRQDFDVLPHALDDRRTDESGVNRRASHAGELEINLKGIELVSECISTNTDI
jgi:hypothetical protein